MKKSTSKPRGPSEGLQWSHRLKQSVKQKHSDSSYRINMSMIQVKYVVFGPQPHKKIFVKVDMPFGYATLKVQCTEFMSI